MVLKTNMIFLLKFDKKIKVISSELNIPVFQSTKRNSHQFKNAVALQHGTIMQTGLTCKKIPL